MATTTATVPHLLAVIYPQDNTGTAYVGWVEDTTGLWRSSQLTGTSRTDILNQLKAEATKIRASTSTYIPEKIQL